MVANHYQVEYPKNLLAAGIIGMSFLGVNSGISNSHAHSLLVSCHLYEKNYRIMQMECENSLCV